MRLTKLSYAPEGDDIFISLETRYDELATIRAALDEKVCAERVKEDWAQADKVEVVRSFFDSLLDIL